MNFECRFGRGGGIGDTGRDPRGSPSPSTAPQPTGLSTANLAASSQVGVPAVAHCGIVLLSGLGLRPRRPRAGKPEKEMRMLVTCVSRRLAAGSAGSRQPR